jgi:hypothetical protein
MGTQGARIDVWRDISEQFSFLDEQLVYVDAPLEGFLRSSKTGDLFAFRCSGIIGSWLWHWVLLPVSSIEPTVKEVFASARTTPPKRWLSIVEDRRGEEPQLYAAWLTGDVHELPRNACDG